MGNSMNSLQFLIGERATSRKLSAKQMNSNYATSDEAMRESVTSNFSHMTPMKIFAPKLKTPLEVSTLRKINHKITNRETGQAVAVI